MWLLIRSIYLKYDVDPLRNKEVIVNIIFLRTILNSRGDKSKNIGARVMNPVT
jgi:hypothetical protein